MPRLEFVLELDAPLEAVWQFHNNIETLFVLTPPHTKARLVGEARPMAVGVVFRLKMRRMGVPLPIWDAEIVEFTPPYGFVDRQVSGRGPFRAWRHEHRFEAISGDRTRIRDTIVYELPFGVFGRIADRLFLRRDLEQLFAFRHKKTRELLTASSV